MHLQSQSPRALAPLCPATAALAHARAVARPCARLPLHAQAARSWAARLRARAPTRLPAHARVPSCPPSRVCVPSPPLLHTRALVRARSCTRARARPQSRGSRGRGLAPRYPVAVVTAWGRCAHARWVGRRFPPPLSSPRLLPRTPARLGFPSAPSGLPDTYRFTSGFPSPGPLWASPGSPELPEAFLPPGSPQVSSPLACPSSPSDLSQVSPFPFILPKLFSSLIFPLPEPFVASALLPHAKL